MYLCIIGGLVGYCLAIGDMLAEAGFKADAGKCRLLAMAAVAFVALLALL